MRPSPIQLTPPNATAALVSTDDIKLHCRVDHSEDDALLDALVKSAESYLDGYSGALGLCLFDQTWAQSFTQFDSQMTLPFPNIYDSEKVVVKYLDEQDAEQTFAGEFELVNCSRETLLIYPSSETFPAVNCNKSLPVWVEFEAGFGSDSNAIDPVIITATKMLVAHWYENREAVSADRMESLPLGVSTLLQRYMRFV